MRSESFMDRLFVLTVLVSCLFPSNLHAEAMRVKVFVSIAPQQYFVGKIGGDRVAVSVLVAPGADPHTYEPKPRQMAELAKSSVYFAVGIDFEKAWMEKIAATNPSMRVVRTDAGIEKRSIGDHRAAHATTADDVHRTEKHQHPEGGLDPHIWLSPPLVKIQAKHIAQGLIAVDPAHRTRYEENYADFLRELEALDTELKSLFAASRGARFIVFHPSWGYFAQAYGLKQVPIEIEGKDPKPAQLKKLIDRAREEDIKVVFVQPQFSQKSAEMVAREIGGQVVSVDPLAANWAENLHEVGRRFKAAFR
jgi:zinc transport system substrate-binding protein